jgi:type VI secretion system secreted protein VgrG
MLSIHAQKDMSTKVENDQSTEVGNDKTTTVEGKNSLTVRRSDSTSVGGKRSVTVSGELSRTIEKLATEKFNAGLKQTVTGNADVDITGVRTVHVNEADRLNAKEILQQANERIFSEVGPSHCYITLDCIQLHSNDVSLRGLNSILLTNEVCDLGLWQSRMELKCGDSSITIMPNEIQIKSQTVTIAADTKATITGPGGKVELTSGIVEITGGQVKLN